MKIYAGGYLGMLLLAGIGFAPQLHATDENSVEKVLGTWSGNSLQAIEASGIDPLQQAVQNKLQKMIQNSMQLQQPQLRMHIRLSDEMPVELNRNSSVNGSTWEKLPQSRISTSRDNLG